MTTTTESFGQRLRLERHRQALSQDELATVAGISRITVIKLESDTNGRQPRPSTVRKLARALGVRPAQLTTPT
jgi:transcriptional regulator with XRE-family HTH domain